MDRSIMERIGRLEGRCARQRAALAALACLLVAAAAVAAAGTLTTGEIALVGGELKFTSGGRTIARLRTNGDANTFTLFGPDGANRVNMHGGGQCGGVSIRSADGSCAEVGSSNVVLLGPGFTTGERPDKCSRAQLGVNVDSSEPSLRLLDSTGERAITVDNNSFAAAP